MSNFGRTMVLTDICGSGDAYAALMCQSLPGALDRYETALLLRDSESQSQA